MLHTRRFSAGGALVAILALCLCEANAPCRSASRNQVDRAIALAAQGKHDEAVPLLVEALKDKDLLVRHSAADALIGMGKPAFPAIGEALKNGDMDTLITVDMALREIRRAAVPVYLKALESENQQVRFLCRSSLENLELEGFAGLRAAPVGENETFRLTATEILRKINALPTTKPAAQLDLQATDGSGNTLLHIAAKSGDTETMDFPIKLGPGVNARNQSGRSVLDIAQRQGHSDAVKLLASKGAQTHYERTIYFKLPLRDVRFHWKFYDRKAYLRGHLILRIWNTAGTPQEITIFNQGEIADGWRVIGEGTNSRKEPGAYFGFHSSQRYETARGDRVEIELHVAEDLRGGWARGDTGTLPKAAYKAKGMINMVSNEPRVSRIEGGTIRSPGWTAFLKWDTTWALRGRTGRVDRRTPSVSPRRTPSVSPRRTPSAPSARSSRAQPPSRPPRPKWRLQGHIRLKGETLLLALIAVIGGGALLIAVVYDTARARRTVRNFSRLAERYGGACDAGGWFGHPRPTIQFQHDFTWVLIDVYSTGRVRRTFYTQIHFFWPGSTTRCEIYPEPRFARVRKLFGMQDIRIGSPAFDSRFIIQGSDEVAIRDFLSPAVQQQIERLRLLLGNDEIYISCNKRELLVKKRTYIRDYNILAQLTALAVALYDNVEQKALEGIEFVKAAASPRLTEAACQICGEMIETDVVFCRRCKTPHHSDCWEYYGACSTYGCLEKRYLRPQSKRARRARTMMER